MVHSLCRTLFSNKRNKLLIHTTTLKDLKRITLSRGGRGSQSQKAAPGMIPFTDHSWDDEIRGMKSRAVAAREQGGVGREVVTSIQGQDRCPCDGPVLCLTVWWHTDLRGWQNWTELIIHTNEYMWNLHEVDEFHQMSISSLRYCAV